MWRKPLCRVCGVRWTCDEAKRERLRSQSLRIRNDHTGAWAAGATMEYPTVGHVGRMTRAQAWRGNGGRADRRA
jgi:hypothetical protein